VLKEILVIDKTDNIRHADQNITQILPSIFTRKNKKTTLIIKKK